MTTLSLTTKVQQIYYMNEVEQLLKTYATSDKRISLKEAELILQAQEIPFKEILKVQFQKVDIEIPTHEFLSYVK